VTPIEELRLLLRPAGGGLYLVSTGKAEQLAMQRRLYDAATDADVERRWHEAMERLRGAKAFVLGVPSDVGAGFRRGANLGPMEIRKAMLDAFPDWPERMAAHDVVDLGDVFVVPQLLHDEMLSDAQLTLTRKALYGHSAAALAAGLPVSPLSITERALDLVQAIAPQAKPMVIGGDHSVAWPVVASLFRGKKERFCVVQPDAHTDLLEERLGVRYCFATWSFHANELFGRDGRMIQVGVRASGKDRGHWESSLGARQFWANECRADPDRALSDIVAAVKATGSTSVYFSNDIDGTDEAFADATGTPEPLGLDPDFVVELIRRLGREVGLLGADLVEVAPCIQDRPDSRSRTLATSVRYMQETLSALTDSRW
jgi:agmatinase